MGGQKGGLRPEEGARDYNLTNCIHQAGVTVRLGPIHFLSFPTIVLHRDRLLPPSLDDQYLPFLDYSHFLAHAYLIRRASFILALALNLS
jgi:hypothetical protein